MAKGCNSCPLTDDTNNAMKQYTQLDRFISQFDTTIKTLFGGIEAQATRPSPADNPNDSLDSDAALDNSERLQSARLMRVNHCGEICAQALYQGQALTAKNPTIKVLLNHSAEEEKDHLAWCEQRLTQLDSHTTYLGPFFYAGSFAIGVTAGALGDQWNLGFVGETEKQVEQHLASHLEKISTADLKSRAIIKQMQQDEINHGNTAMNAGGATLPKPIQAVMQLTSKAMTATTYWV
jgi:ubiquinone biosynthesis monooxygenase Coq7